MIEGLEKRVCSIYTRVSTEDQAREDFSLGKQKKRLTDYCEAMGFDIYGYYKDAGISAKTGNHRPEFERMLEDGYDLNQEKVGKMNSNGRESIKSTFDELERNDYLVRTDSRDDGRYFKTDYAIYDKSIIPNRVNPKIKNAQYMDLFK